MVEYSSVLAPKMATIFPPEDLTDTLGEVAAKAGKTPPLFDSDAMPKFSVSLSSFSDASKASSGDEYHHVLSYMFGISRCWFAKS